MLLQRALKEAQQTAQAADTIEPEEIVEAIEDRDAKLCADCWNAKTFRTDSGQHMARCGKDLWLRASYPLEDLNNHRVRRWYTDCPEYDDSE